MRGPVRDYSRENDSLERHLSRKVFGYRGMNLSTERRQSFHNSNIYKLGAWFHDYSDIPFNLGAMVLFAAAPMVPVSWPWISCFWSAAVLMGFFGLRKQRDNSSRLSELEPLVESLDATVGEFQKNIPSESRAFLREIIREIFKRHKLTHQDRITIYQHIEAEDYFVAVARYYSSPELAKFGREFYPKGQGIIWKAWDEGCAHGSHKLTGDTEEFLELLKDTYQIPNNAAKRIRMRSQSLIAVKIENAASFPRGVAVIESTEYAKSEFESVADTIVVQQHALSALLNIVALNGIDPVSVAKEGY